jgi:hypothetical protein
MAAIVAYLASSTMAMSAFFDLICTDYRRQVLGLLLLKPAAKGRWQPQLLQPLR